MHSGISGGPTGAVARLGPGPVHIRSEGMGAGIDGLHGPWAGGNSGVVVIGQGIGVAAHRDAVDIDQLADLKGHRIRRGEDRKLMIVGILISRSDIHYSLLLVIERIARLSAGPRAAEEVLGGAAIRRVRIPDGVILELVSI